MRQSSFDLYDLSNRHSKELRFLYFPLNYQRGVITAYLNGVASMLNVVKIGFNM
jgi:hypothetical protein